MLATSAALRRRFSQQQQQQQPQAAAGRSWRIPATLGFALIGALQWHQLNHPTDEERKTRPAPALRRLPGERSTFEDSMATERQLQSLKLLPYRAASRLWGQVHDQELYVTPAGSSAAPPPLALPEVINSLYWIGLDWVGRSPLWLREPVYKAWTAVFDCKLDEMKHPLQHYANLGEFFSRPLKDGARPFDTVPGHLASPVDGTVASIGVVGDASDVPTLEQVKGARYRLDEFLGGLPSFFSNKSAADKGKKMFHCVLYLAPGDYHRIHAPVDWKVEERRHFPGNLFPVNQTAAHLIPSLFVENERVALLGEWDHGFFSLTAVGATNVGSIVLTKEPEFRTNTAAQDPLVGQCISKVYGGKVDTTRGEEMAQFKVGLTFFRCGFENVS
ncbi:unnamed protein product [Phytophthora fragariaefolia]|uniref:phosphatidylserine decarboxylase n=1 Tax=Phytophthora fragariaefolia TaxID=1490495 RepID=A0A9W6U2A8_9STRA|nr:unnamed protein product [Phytophthora fragariaefolia]